MYYLMVFQVLPMFMRNRKPFTLKKFIVCYNIWQIFYCSFVVRMLYDRKPDMWKLWRCFNNTESNDPDEYFMMSVIYWGRVVDLSETMVFVLRKKENQVSFLHVFHHAATLVMTYVAAHWHYRRFFLSPTFSINNSFFQALRCTSAQRWIQPSTYLCIHITCHQRFSQRTSSKV